MDTYLLEKVFTEIAKKKKKLQSTNTAYMTHIFVIFALVNEKNGKKNIHTVT